MAVMCCVKNRWCFKRPERKNCSHWPMKRPGADGRDQNGLLSRIQSTAGRGKSGTIGQIRDVEACFTRLTKEGLRK